MGWLLILVAIVLLFWWASSSRRQKQRAAVAALRANFPSIARMRLVAACPRLADALDDADLRFLFDWIWIELCRRTGASDFDELMQWSIKNGEAEAQRMTAEVTREAVDRLPRPVLAIIDDCGGRTVAGVILDEALTAAGQRIAPELRQKHV